MTKNENTEKQYYIHCDFIKNHFPCNFFNTWCLNYSFCLNCEKFPILILFFLLHILPK